MPLNNGCTIDALSENIAASMSEGTPRLQAIALAQDVLKRSCQEQGVPVPQSGMGGVTKTVQARTMEFLEAALEKARSLLPPRDFAVIFRAARGAAGGKIKARNQRESQSVNKASAEINDLPDDAFAMIVPGGEKDDGGKTVPRDLRKLPHHTADVENPNDNGTLDLPKLRNALARFEQTDFPNAALKAAAKKHLDRHAAVALPSSEAAEEREKRSDVVKGFVNGDPEGGMHAHGIDRNVGHSFSDGAHMHVWVMPGTDAIFGSFEDGAHVHVIDGNATPRDGDHTHQVTMPNGDVAMTDMAGAHQHELMLETSGFSGLHKHILTMPDGTELESLSPADFADRFGARPGVPLMSATKISNCLNRARDLKQIVNDLLFEVSHRDELLQGLMNQGFMDQAFELPTMPMMVMAEADGMVEIAFADGDDELYRKSINKSLMPIKAGDIVDVSADGSIKRVSNFRVSVVKSAGDKFFDGWKGVLKSLEELSFRGPEDASVMFVLPVHKMGDDGRCQPFEGDVAEYFDNRYLAPLKIEKEDIRIGYVPGYQDDLENEELCKNVRAYVQKQKGEHTKVVAIGKNVRTMLGDVADFFMPHPNVVKKCGDYGEINRKTKHINKWIDKQSKVKHTKSASPTQGDDNLVDPLSETKCIHILKSDDEKQIVYGVVLDPYQVDAHNDWIPPSDVEDTAHGFLTKSRVIGFEHQDRANAEVVESFVEAYPTPADRKAAFANQPHAAYVRKFGDDEIHSGAWIIGVKVGDAEWLLVKSGEIDAFSIGGFGEKKRVSKQMMPEVSFVSPE
jgi:hypothetical protein